MKQASYLVIGVYEEISPEKRSCDLEEVVADEGEESESRTILRFANDGDDDFPGDSWSRVGVWRRRENHRFALSRSHTDESDGRGEMLVV